MGRPLPVWARRDLTTPCRLGAALAQPFGRAGAQARPGLVGRGDETMEQSEWATRQTVYGS